MEEVKQPGIIIRAHPSGEADLILKILTPALGKISAIAKHARKSKSRFSGGFEIFDHLSFTLKPGRGSLYSIKSAERLPSLMALRENLEKLAAASLLAEAFDFLIREDSPDTSENYELLDLGLRAIADSVGVKEILRALFLTLSEFLKIAGFHSTEAGERPSSKSLRHLMAVVEQSAEKPLRSRPPIEEIIVRLEAQQIKHSGNTSPENKPERSERS